LSPDAGLWVADTTDRAGLYAASYLIRTSPAFGYARTGLKGRIIRLGFGKLLKKAKLIIAAHRLKP